ncbi:PucR family transcriptional regulator [Streptomyces sp. NPDC006530]|uniref:PucR family transcriptional regulator n=1 Tax=Streptomyces sp. NPDC006530 TaxID=3364750 RepID=UPI0036935D23
MWRVAPACRPGRVSSTLRSDAGEVLRADCCAAASPSTRSTSGCAGPCTASSPRPRTGCSAESWWPRGRCTGGGPSRRSLCANSWRSSWSTRTGRARSHRNTSRRPSTTGRVVLFVLAPGPADGLPQLVLDCGALEQRLATALARWLGPADSVSVGVSSPVAAPENAPRALDDARTAMRVAAGSPGKVRVRGPDDLTSYILTLLPHIPARTRHAFAARLLGPLRDHDSRDQTDLLPTLEAFLGCDASWTTCAAQLRLHVNSLRQRIARIEQITGRDLSRLETRLDFLAALERSDPPPVRAGGVGAATRRDAIRCDAGAVRCDAMRRGRGGHGQKPPAPTWLPGPGHDRVTRVDPHNLTVDPIVFPPATALALAADQGKTTAQ